MKKGGGRKRGRQQLELTFDADARREYLTGFSKRKAQRRKFGLAMQMLKDKEAIRENRKQRREAMREARGLPENVDDDDDDDDDDSDGHDDQQDEDEKDAEISRQERREDQEERQERFARFEDRFTQETFGDVVTVVTTLGVPAPLDEDDIGHVDGEQEQEQEQEQEPASSQEHRRQKAAGRQRHTPRTRREQALELAKKIRLSDHSKRKKKQAARIAAAAAVAGGVGCRTVGGVRKGGKGNTDSTQLVQKALGRTVKRGRGKHSRKRR